MGKTKVLVAIFIDKIGPKGDNLYDGRYWFKELCLNKSDKDFSALGNLPYKHKLKITYKGKSAIALKCGAGPCDPNNAKIALHIVLTQYLGITKPGITYIDIERA